jgi:hypothetical protein
LLRRAQAASTEAQVEELAMEVGAHFEQGNISVRVNGVALYRATIPPSERCWLKGC